MGWDAGFLIYIQEHLRSEILTPLMTFITHSGDKGILWIVLCIILVLIPRSRSFGLIAGTSIAVEFLFNNIILKNLVARQRPYEAVEGLINIIEDQTDYSFPSGHSGASFAVAGALFIIALLGVPGLNEKGIIIKQKTSVKYRFFAVLLLIYAALIAFSRLYVGVHYPTDVIGGIILGAATSFLAYFMYQLILSKLPKKQSENTVSGNT